MNINKVINTFFLYLLLLVSASMIIYTLFATALGDGNKGLFDLWLNHKINPIMTTFIGIMIMGAIYLVLGMVVASYKKAFKAYILAIIGTLLVTAASYMMINYNIPSALDVYRNKTELKITSVNGVPQDTIVVYKK